MKNLINKSFFQEIRNILKEARQKTYSAINFTMVEAYWQIGKRIVEEEQVGKERADYGSFLIKGLSKELSSEFGKGFSIANLKNFRQFYLVFPDLEKSYTLCSQLTWSHLRLIMRVDNQNAREYQIKEAVDQTWSTRQLDRNISTHYYERILKSTNLQKFLLEMGKGFSFVGRQFRISTESTHFYIDLVFYNYILKCFVLIDLKTGKLAHQDIGQMDMYVRMFDDLKRQEDDNPTIGIILCSGKDDTTVKYSVLKESEQLFASKYRLILPTEEELIAELEREKKLIRENIKDMDEKK